MYSLQFFSKPSNENQGDDNTPYGYDGSMTLEAFEETDIPALLKSMDCIYGPCLVHVNHEYFNTITQSNTFSRSVYSVTRTHED